jgi:hypothetical protein
MACTPNSGGLRELEELAANDPMICAGLSLVRNRQVSLTEALARIVKAQHWELRGYRAIRTAEMLGRVPPVVINCPDRQQCPLQHFVRNDEPTGEDR